MTIPLWLVLALAVIAIGVVVLVIDERETRGGFIQAPPVLGLLALLASVIAALAIYVVHLKGWLWL